MNISAEDFLKHMKEAVAIAERIAQQRDEALVRLVAVEGGASSLDWLAQRQREAAAKELEGIWNRWCRDESYGPSIWELWWFVYDRAAALRAGKGGDA